MQRMLEFIVQRANKLISIESVSFYCIVRPNIFFPFIFVLSFLFEASLFQPRARNIFGCYCLQIKYSLSVIKSEFATNYNVINNNNIYYCMKYTHHSSRIKIALNILYANCPNGQTM